MNIFTFLRIFWARRVVILAATISCLIGAIIVMLIAPPRWTGTARVILEVLKPDPVTGLVMGREATVYIAAQQALITDYSVAGRVLDELGEMSDPNAIQQYRNRPKNDTRDFRHWLAYRIIQSASADVVQGTNIMEIKFASPKPENARTLADAFRRAYMDVSLQMKRDDANRNAEWYEQQSQKLRSDLDVAQTKVAAFEKEHGIAMADNSTDIDTARLRALSVQGALAPAAMPPPEASPVAVELAQVDADLAQALKTLGPNHPEVQTLRGKRASLAALAASEETKRVAAVAKARAETQNAVQQAVQAQRSKVVNEKGNIDELTLLERDVAVLQASFDKTEARAVELRQQASVADAGITPLGAATIPPQPDFPNPMLIIGGAIVLGLGMGVGVALLSELLARRVRSGEDLESAIDAPLLAVISAPTKARRGSGRGARPQLNWPSGGRKAVQG